jgi:hypothetical protein
MFEPIILLALLRTVPEVYFAAHTAGKAIISDRPHFI